MNKRDQKAANQAKEVVRTGWEQKDYLNSTQLSTLMRHTK